MCVHTLTKASTKTKKNNYEQEAQLSQRDHTAGWVSFGQKWKTGTGDDILQTL